MQLSSTEALRRLGAGESIDEVCAAAGLTRSEFDAWWAAECAARVCSQAGARKGPVGQGVEIRRDAFGIPHIFAARDEDLFTGYGYAMAQDRLWQMDYLRRRAHGRLAELLGREALQTDLLARTLGLPAIAEAEISHLPGETVRLLEAFSAGVNAHLRDAGDKLPIEFDLLDYRPEPWRPVDSAAVLVEFRWYLTGRFPVITLPELARRSFGYGKLYDAFLTAEAADETILPPGSYAGASAGVEPLDHPLGGSEDGTGSNNWVIGARRSASGAALVASDPHIAFGAASCWYHVHLHGGSFNVAGAGYAGVPAVLIGRNERVAWGVTNNICSQRDLYLEQTDPYQGNSFLYDGAWEAALARREEIRVKGEGVVTKTVRSSRHGPIVDEILPAGARDTGPVSLRWMGAKPCGWLTSMLGTNRARSCDEFREALRGWVLPTFSLVFADVEGHIGYQATGQLPVRAKFERGYLRGWDPADEWRGVIPFEGMPALRDPASGWIATANNLTAPLDYPYILANQSPSGLRARRIRQMIEAADPLTGMDCQRMQYDVLYLRAVQGVPALVQLLDGDQDERTAHAAALLNGWDHRMDEGSAAAAIFEVFFTRWVRRVADERFTSESESVALGDPGAFTAGGLAGLALELLSADEPGWFGEHDREEAIRETFSAALAELSERLGTEMAEWNWGRLHTLTHEHYLSARGDLGSLLDRGGEPVSGNGFTVCNTGSAASYLSRSGAGYRMVVDLAESPPRLWAIDAAGESGAPGSAHYCDQLNDWIGGRYHELPLDAESARRAAQTVLTLDP